MRDWYTGQLVAQEEMDDAFAQLEAADRDVVADGGATGIYSGLGVTEKSGGANLTVDVATGTAYGPSGERMRAGSTANVNCAVDKNGVTTTVTVNIEQRILSVIMTPDRTLDDPRTDATNSTVYWIRNEAYRIELIQGAQAVVATPPAIPAGSILLADITRLFGQTQILNADINLTGRRQDQIAITGSPFGVRRGKVKDAFSDVVGRYNSHVTGGLDQHNASDIVYGGSGFWADGSTTVAAGQLGPAISEIVSDLASMAASDAGGQRVGIDQDDSVGSNVLGAATLKSRLQAMRLATALFYAGSPAWADASVIAAGTIEAAIDAIPTALGGTAGGQRVGMAAVGNFSNGTLQGGFAALAATTPGVDGLSKIGAQAVGNFTGATARAQITELTATTAANDGAKRVGAQANGNLAAGTVRTQLDELDAEKGGLALANTWTNANVWSSTNAWNGQGTFGGGLWPGLDPREIRREHSLNVMSMTHASVATINNSDLTVSVLGDTVAAPNIVTAVQGSSGRAFLMEIKRPLHGNTMSGVEIESKYIGPASDASMTKANYTVLRWKVTTSGLPGGDIVAIEALHAGALVDDHNSSNYGNVRTQTVTLTTNNVVNLDEWRYALRVEVPYGAVSADAQLRVYSVRSVYAAANTLRHG
ncbi:MAG: hypothetical protein EKK55_24520 [Rhodocyclaceae bacterium]|nr:MAG: hypothetical protein EKK55_24520 [Rhodocyclaceae bacterium]